MKKITELVPPGLAYPPKFGSPTALALKVENFIYVSGMIAWDEDRKIVGVGDPKQQTVQALENMRACLQAGGADFRDIVKITFYLTDIRDKSVVWEARKTRSEGHTSELQSLMRISYAVFCLKTKNVKQATRK